MNETILIVDDETSILTLLEYNLTKSGFKILTEMDGNGAISRVIKDNPDLIIVDVMMPYMDGLEVCKELRLRKIKTPIILLTANNDEFDRILGLELGADDYITKPFSLREVIARIKAILRRTTDLISEEKGDSKITIGDLAIFQDKHEVYLGDSKIELTLKEFELLVYLSKNKDHIIKRDQLLQNIWKYDFDGETRIVDVHISHLREKMEKHSKKTPYIKTIRGVGYMLVDPQVEDRKS